MQNYPTHVVNTVINEKKIHKQQDPGELNFFV